MSANPFVADTNIARRQLELSSRSGAAVARELAQFVQAKQHHVEENLGAVILAAEAAMLVESFALADVEELMLLALPVARELARPPISNFFVGAVGLERETGNLLLGGNVEFPGAQLGFTIHGEGFVFTRAASRDTSIAVLAIGEAHPCAHCRQYLSEFAQARDLLLIDPLGHRLSLSALYPWPFDPAYLGETGFAPGAALCDLDIGAHDLPAGIARQLVDAGRRAHAPYSKCPGAIVLSLTDGNTVAGFSIESVAFNPSMGPLPAAMIDLIAHGYGPEAVVSATLGTVTGGAVDYTASTAELLGTLAPGAPLTTIGWK